MDEVTKIIAACDNLMKVNFTKKRIFSLAVKVNEPVGMFSRILIFQDGGILAGSFALNVSEPARMPPFGPIRGHIEVTRQTDRDIDVLTTGANE